MINIRNRNVKAISCKIFTLIELLLVIGIIALLAAMLMPALSSAKNKAREVLCISNIKQIGLNTLSYVNDYSGWGPPFVSAPVWHLTLGNAGYITQTKVLVCPSWGPFKFDTSITNYLRYTYGNNRTLAPDLAGRIQARTRPSSDAYFSDTISRISDASAGLQYYYFKPKFSSAEACVHLRHSKGANMFFMDGHILNVKAKSLEGLDITDFLY